MSDDVERRKNKRVKGHIRVAYGPQSIVVSDLTEDLSDSGVYVRTPYPLDLATVLQIEIHWNVPGRAKPHILKLHGHVARVNSGAENAGMGIEFDDLTADDKAQLDRILASLQN